MSSSRDDRFHGTLGKPRRTPPLGDPQGSVFFQTGQGGRTVLPPLSSAFPTSRSAVPPTYSNQYSQPRSSPGRYDYNPQAFYNGWPTNSNSPQPTSSFTNYENHERYSTQPSYTTYPSRSSPPLQGHSPDSRKLPPLATNTSGDRWTAPSYLPTTGGNYNGNSIRSPMASYPTPYAGFATSNQASAYSYGLPMDSHHHPHVSNMNAQVHGPVYDDMDSGRGMPRSSSPYNRTPTQVQPPNYTPPPVSPTSPDEPTIKKKRKRADAAQLKVLNETYNRTAFPSTEERLALAKLLDMSARSVQIWFQNKRQSMRQTNRQSSTMSSSSHQSFSISGQDPLLDDLSQASGGVYGGSVAMTDPSYLLRPLQDGARSHTSHSSTSPSHRRVRNQEDVDTRKWPGY